MEYRALGDTGLTVSAIGFGCWEMGNPGYGSYSTAGKTSDAHAIDYDATHYGNPLPGLAG